MWYLCSTPNLQAQVVCVCWDFPTVPKEWSSTKTLAFQKVRGPGGRFGLFGNRLQICPLQKNETSGYQAKPQRWVFPKIVVPQNRWLIMENPIKMDDLGVPLFSETSIWYQKVTRSCWWLQGFGVIGLDTWIIFIIFGIWRLIPTG